MSYSRSDADRFSDIHDLVHDLVTDKWMETIRSNEIDRYPEPFRDQVSQVDERHHTDWLVKFDNEIEIAAGGLGLPCIRSKDTDTPDMKPFPLVPVSCSAAGPVSRKCPS